MRQCCFPELEQPIVMPIGDSFSSFKHHDICRSRTKILGVFFHIFSRLRPQEIACTDKYDHGIKFYASFLLDSTKTKSLSQGKITHSHLILTALQNNDSLASNLVVMYAVCGSMEDARQVFDKIPERNAFLWNTMIRGNACEGSYEEALRLYYRMQGTGIQPNNFTFPFVLKACAALAALEEGKAIHGHLIREGYEFDLVVRNALMVMYNKCGSVDVARKLFDHMLERDVVSWNVIIAGYCQNGQASEALTLFCRMRMGDVKHDSVTTVSALQACANLEALRKGQDIHNLVVKNGFELDVSVGNSLLAMYSKCGMIKDASLVFDKMTERNLVSWNSMIAGYAQNGHAHEALKLFHEMKFHNLKPDQVTLASVLPACADLGVLQEGKDIHDYIIENSFESNVTLVNSLIAMYAKCGNAGAARQLFDNMSNRNIVSWNAMITGHIQNEQAIEALSIFHEMQLSDIKPDIVTMVSVITACASLAALQQGKYFHGYVVKCRFNSSDMLENSLIDMYAKCGRLDIAHLTFDKMSRKDVISWTAMISGYAMHGLAKDALALFAQMVQSGTKPDHVTFTHILSACTHAGLVDEGWQYFICMSRDYCITPRVDHYACMVDLLGRAGHLHEAKEFINNMPLEPNAGVWGALLAACRIHGNIELGEHAAQRLFELKPDDAGNYVLLSNIYAAAGMWKDAAKIRTMMKHRGLTKNPGHSLIQVNNKVHLFVAGDRSHPLSEKIYALLETLSRQMKEAGYVPDTSFELHNVEGQ